ncbi:bifunctional adenosylcobinamide kinase/adenosylcobinamide-phosphate guanylyltransferase [Litchfieldella xinjiangensis]|uniref:bifunctional adenosylcobinamide kinase/adenosylcobinamide-phosphate guanylyltransferase n=1 Tax=Litchfieldella xinjiangensis TaxID=1166948 RepID=UPI0005BD547A|nr:bifunctional adenosylcobinamide kinase/adenosylcobinamide-phosphate guanylyltransferase [Halomonas xinjiangensis]
MIAFISGGARSGKSVHAEQLARQWQREHGGALVYLATASAPDAQADPEMASRIRRHRESRGEGWSNLEEPVHLDTVLGQVPSGAVVLIDCLTLWASQVLYTAGLDETRGLDIIDSLLAEARARDVSLVIVSNDINEGLPPQDAEVWRYLDFLMGVHRRVAQEADEVIQVMAGLPQCWKRPE